MAITDDAGHGSILPADFGTDAWYKRFNPWHEWDVERWQLNADGLDKDEILAVIGPEPTPTPFQNADGSTPQPGE